jgi:hypothetical protein
MLSICCFSGIVRQIPVGDEILIKTLGLNLSLFSKRMGFFLPLATHALCLTIEGLRYALCALLYAV